VAVAGWSGFRAGQRAALPGACASWVGRLGGWQAVFEAALRVVTEAARRVDLAAVPRQVLDVVSPGEVAGRRAWQSTDRAVIEIRGLERPGHRGRVGDLQRQLEGLPGVGWARVNIPVARVVVALTATGERRGVLAQLIGAVSRWEGEPPVRREQPPVAACPAGLSATRAAVTVLAADTAAVGLAVLGNTVGVATLAAELAALVTFVDTQPRLRELIERRIGAARADVAIAVTNAAAQGMARGLVGLSLDIALRVALLGEAQANRDAWARRAPRDGRIPQTTPPFLAGPARPGRLPPGPVEAWADSALIAAGSGFAVGLATLGGISGAAGLAVAALPKAGKFGREGFATQLGRVAARRGALLADRSVLRRLDRVDTVMIDVDAVHTGRSALGSVTVLPGADQSTVLLRLHGLFRPDHAGDVHRGDGWSVGPVDQLGLRGRAGVRESRQLRARGARAVLGVAEGHRLMGVAGVHREQSESLEALAAACRRSRRRLVLAVDDDAAGTQRLTAFADVTVPGGARLAETVRDLQAGGAVVLLVSRDGAALTAADCGIGVDPHPDHDHGWAGVSGAAHVATQIHSGAGPAEGGVPPPGADIWIGDDLSLAALVIDACGAAASVSRRSVQLAQVGTALGTVAVTTGGPLGRAQRSLLAVNGAAWVALLYGGWAALELARRPLAPPVSRVPWHAVPAQAVLARLGTGPDGLSREQLRARRKAAGTSAADQPSFARAVVDELANPLTPILAGGAAVSAAVGSVVDAGLVAGVSALSALIGGAQRLRTDRALTGLLSASAVPAVVHRDGIQLTTTADDLVVGDLVLLRAGDVVPADCRIVTAAGAEVDESSLTGEPFPVVKHTEPVLAVTVAERRSMAYEGTTVTAGRATAVVVAVGSATEAGRSAAATRGAAPITGVQARLEKITRITLPIAVGSAGAVVAAGLLRGRAVRDTLGAGVNLAVASVPEGLPFLVTAAQLAAARRLSRHGALVRNPRTIEALGRVDVLCFDKTGTLTEGRIALTAIADDTTSTPIGDLDDRHRAVLAVALRATPPGLRRARLGSQTDQAVITGAAAAGVHRHPRSTRWYTRATLPFQPAQGFHATLGVLDPDPGAAAVPGGGAGAVLSVKGAPESVLPRCTHLIRAGRPQPLRRRDRHRLDNRVHELAAQGHRILAVAERPAAPAADLVDSDVGDLCLQGLLVFSDPIRATARSSVARLRAAGTQIVMITGDHPGTAATIAERLDVLRGGTVITGPQLDGLDDAALEQLLPGLRVVARGTPAHKVRIVQAFQRLGRTVAMTGDGANDAPAIRLADVGIALGRRGTPAARAAADLVVTDDRLETILAALVEGRSMWKSVRQALAILVGGNLGEIGFTVLGAALTGISPLSTRQLLVVNLLTDLAPGLAVALRAPTATTGNDLLREGPEASLGAALTRDIGIRAAITTVGATAAWAAAYGFGLGAVAPTIALAGLVGTQLGQTIAVDPTNRTVAAASAASIAALAVIIQTPTLSAFFGCTPLGLAGWVIAVSAATAATGAGAALPTVIGQTLVREKTTPDPAVGIPAASRDRNTPHPDRRVHPRPAALAAITR